MPRNISSAALAKINQNLAGEPIILVDIVWTPTRITRYSDKAIAALGMTGKILEISPIEDFVNINNGNNSQSVTIKLDDTDGSIKNLYNLVDIHKRPVVIYQWFRDLPINDAFVIFEGLINSPITWKEGDRTFSFEVLSRIEDVEMGFSVDDGIFTNVPVELLGKAWPLVFGTVINVPVLQIDRTPTGAVQFNVGITDPTINKQLRFIECQAGKQLAIAACLSEEGAKLQFEGDLGGGGGDLFEKGKQFQQRAEDIRRQVTQQMNGDKKHLGTIQNHQIKNYDINNFPVLNGFKFPQGIPLGVKIGEAHYYGMFHGINFSVISRRGPNSLHPAPPGIPYESDFSQVSSDPVTIEDPQSDLLNPDKFGVLDEDDFFTPTDQDKKEDPCGPHNLLLPDCGSQGTNRVTAKQKEGTFHFITAGTPVKPDYNYHIRFVANIIPGTEILSVSARRSYNGTKVLVAIPPEYYSIRTENYGAVQPTIIELNQPLSSILYEDWEDQIYVTMRSTIGPNVVDILVYLIERWAPGYGIDNPSFTHVRAVLNAFPANFVLFERKNIVEILKEIAYQARCAIWLSSGVFYIRFLAEDPTPVETITESDIESKSLELITTRTEDLITQYTALWKADHYQTEFNKIILQNNVSKYGLHKQEYTFYIYNDFNLVEIAAAFWIQRLSNVFKVLRFKAFLNKLDLQGMDGVLLDFNHNYVANEDIIGLVQKAQFDSLNFAIDMEIWCPVLLGTMVQFPSAYPANNINAFFAQLNQEAGSQPPNSNAFGNLGHGVIYNIVRTNQRKTTNPKISDNQVIPTNIQTTLTNYSAPGADPSGAKPGGNSDGTNKTNQKQLYDFQYQDYKALERPKIIGGGNNTIPATILEYVGPDTDFSNGQIYTALIFTKGPKKDPVEGEVTAINLDPDSDDRLENGTLFMVSSMSVTKTNPDGSSGEETKYYFEPPVWA